MCGDIEVQVCSADSDCRMERFKAGRSCCMQVLLGDLLNERADEERTWDWLRVEGVPFPRVCRLVGCKCAEGLFEGAGGRMDGDVGCVRMLCPCLLSACLPPGLRLHRVAAQRHASVCICDTACLIACGRVPCLCSACASAKGIDDSRSRDTMLHSGKLVPG